MGIISNCLESLKRMPPLQDHLYKFPDIAAFVSRVLECSRLAADADGPTGLSDNVLQPLRSALTTALRRVARGWALRPSGAPGSSTPEPEVMPRRIYSACAAPRASDCGAGHKRRAAADPLSLGDRRPLHWRAGSR